MALSPCILQATLSLGPMPQALRIGAGMVTWPFLVMVLSIFFMVLPSLPALPT
jgi:hypothetical protein